jgi:hypothetical protein
LYLPAAARGASELVGGRQVRVAVQAPDPPKLRYCETEEANSANIATASPQPDEAAGLPPGSSPAAFVDEQVARASGSYG